MGLCLGALCTVSVHQRATGSRPVNLNGEQMEATGPFHSGSEHRFGWTPVFPFRDVITPPYTGQVSSQFWNCVGTRGSVQGLEGLLAKERWKLFLPASRTKVITSRAFWSERVRTFHVRLSV